MILLLILLRLLIFCPFGRPSEGVHPGVRRVAPCGEAASIERRCSAANRRRCPPDGHRSEGTLSLSEVPYAGAKPFGSFLAFEKGTRCKSETASGNTRSNGYTPNPDPDPNPAFRCSTTNATRKIKRSQPSAAPTGVAVSVLASSGFEAVCAVDPHRGQRDQGQNQQRPRKRHRPRSIQQ